MKPKKENETKKGKSNQKRQIGTHRFKMAITSPEKSD